MSLVYRGTSSDNVKFNVTERRVYNAPAFDVTGIEVPGRSGDVLNSQERFKNKAIVYTGFIRSSDFPGDTTWERLSRGLRTIKAWICGDAGKYHDLTDDYDPGFVRRAFVSGETAISEVLDRPDGATITITFMAEPFMYEESDPIELPETGTASGAIASFEGVAAPLQSLKFYIEPSQDLHGYSYPWPGGGGKNLLDTSASITISNVTISADSSGYVSVSPNNSDQRGWSYNNAQWKLTLPAGNYIISYEVKTASTSPPQGIRVIDSNENNLVNFVASTAFTQDRNFSFTLANSTNIGVMTKLYDGIARFMICRASEPAPTVWSPYSNICPISWWTQVDAMAAGKNLLDADGYTLSAPAGVNQTLVVDHPVYLEAGVTYTFSCRQTASAGSATRNRICVLPASSTSPLAYEATDIVTAHTHYVTYTPSASGNYRPGYWAHTLGNAITLDQWQVEKGSTATAYAAPALTPITIQLGQTVYGATEDALAGKLVIDKRYIEMNGTETWTEVSISSGSAALGLKRYWTTFNASSYPAVINSPTMSNQLKTYAGNSWNVNTVASLRVETQNRYEVAVYSSDFPDATAWKNYLTTHPLQAVYELANPIEVDLTPVSVSSLLGQNNIWANTGDTEVVYVEPTENPTEWPSKPRLEITMSGAGTLTVNGKTWSIGAYTGTLICDSEIMDWYDSSNLKNSLVSGDGFPEFQPGENVITYTGGITKVVAKPRWRTL